MRKIFISLLGFFVLGLFISPNLALAGCHNELTDPVGDGKAISENDVYTYYPYADITSAWMQPAFEFPATEFGVTTIERFPLRSRQNYNIFFFVDIDNDPSNNETVGTRAGADAAFSLLWSAKNQEWKTVSWTYDAPSNAWNSTVNPSILFAPLETEYGFIIHVPYDLVPENADIPFRAAVAASESEGDVTHSSVDTSPDGNGAMSVCDKEIATTTEITTEEPVSAPTEPNEAPPTNEPVKPTDDENNTLLIGIIILITLILLGGLGLAIGTKKERKKNDEHIDGDEDDKKDEEIDDDDDECDCPACSLYICVGKKRDRAIGSALNLGKAIKRDTESGKKKKCCVRVMHFTSKNMQMGRYVGYSKKGKLEWKKFTKHTEGVKKDDHKDICVWNEVMIVMHGEKKSKVKTVISHITSLIPKAPIKRLVLYYCGGGATLPKAEFTALASQLGKRLKNIPKDCRPKEVELFIAPVVSFEDDPTFTVLSINKDGLTSYEGKMMEYTADEKGKVKKIGNQVPNGKLFGCVELGELESTAANNAGTYLSHWRRICKLKLSEIRRYRKLIERANLKTNKGVQITPPFCPKEVKANKIEKVIRYYKADPFSPDELDDLVEKSGREIKRAIKTKIKDHK